MGPQWMADAAHPVGASLTQRQTTTRSSDLGARKQGAIRRGCAAHAYPGEENAVALISSTKRDTPSSLLWRKHRTSSVPNGTNKTGRQSRQASKCHQGCASLAASWCFCHSPSTVLVQRQIQTLLASARASPSSQMAVAQMSPPAKGSC